MLSQNASHFRAAATLGARKPRLFAAVLATAALLLTQGCYHSRIIIDAQPATDYQSRTVHSSLWGLRQENIQPDNCMSNAMQEVGVSWNLGDALLTVVTLGLYSPVQIQWRCAKQRSPQPDTLP